MVRRSIIRKQISVEDTDEEVMKTLETLPNEILLDVFIYFNGAELLHSFFGLNARLDGVLNYTFQKILFPLDCLSKHDFDRICREQIRDMGHLMGKLTLSNGDDTPTQIEIFLSSISGFNQFTRLQSLTLKRVSSSETLMQIIIGSYDLPDLKELNLISCYICDQRRNIQEIMDCIWRLSQLQICTVGLQIEGEHSFIPPKVASESLTTVTIQNNLLSLKQIDQLMLKTPNLMKLSIDVSSFIEPNYVPSGSFNLKTLSINCQFSCGASRMSTMLVNLPFLERLYINLSNDIIDGSQLNTIIRNDLPKLRLIRFRMKGVVPDTDEIETFTNNLIASFRTTFWTHNFQCFIRCLSWNRTVYLHTMPNDYTDHLPVSFKTTSPEDNELEFYKNVTKIVSPTFFGQNLPVNLHLDSITHLCINLPLETSFWSLMTDFAHLTTLEISYHSDRFQTQVQNIFDRTKSLKSLLIRQHPSSSFPRSLFRYRLDSVIELDIREINHYFKENQITELSRSSLVKHCEKLSIAVENPQVIVEIMKTMPKLRILNVRCREEKSILRSFTTETSRTRENCKMTLNDDICLQWLQQRLPSNVIIRDPKLTGCILLWK